MTGLPAVLRPLLLAAAALGLLGSGGVDLAPRPAGPSATATSATATSATGDHTRPAHRQRTDAQQPSAVVRAGLAPAASPSAGGPALAPAAGTLDVPHLVDAHPAPLPTVPHRRPTHDVASGRAPPLTTGT